MGHTYKISICRTEMTFRKNIQLTDPIASAMLSFIYWVSTFVGKLRQREILTQSQKTLKLLPVRIYQVTILYLYAWDCVRVCIWFPCVYLCMYICKKLCMIVYSYIYACKFKDLYMYMYG